MRARFAIAAVLVGAVCALLAAVASAPASLADVVVRQATVGRIRLADTSGSLWSGRARIVLADTAEPPGRSAAIPGLALPGEFSWHLNALPLLVGIIDASVNLDGMTTPVHLSGGFGELRGTASQLNLPSVELSRLGSPWNTIRPSGVLSLRWDDFSIRRGLFDGKLTIELRDTASAMTPVRPLGSYRIDVASSGREATVAIATLSGPLNLQGNGSWNGRTGLRFSAEAHADPSERARLESFLALIGRREGDKTVIRIGA